MARISKRCWYQLPKTVEGSRRCYDKYNSRIPFLEPEDPIIFNIVSGQSNTERSSDMST